MRHLLEPPLFAVRIDCFLAKCGLAIAGLTVQHQYMAVAVVFSAMAAGISVDKTEKPVLYQVQKRLRLRTLRTGQGINTCGRICCSAIPCTTAGHSRIRGVVAYYITVNLI